MNSNSHKKNYKTWLLESASIFLVFAFSISLVLQFGFCVDAQASGEQDPYAFSSYTPLDNFKNAGKNLGNESSLVVLGSGLGAGIAIHQWDADINNHYSHKSRFGEWDKIGNEFLGTGVPGALAGLGFWFYGSRYHEKKAMHSGQAQIEALVSTAVSTIIGKNLARRSRPDGSDPYSFPSGHTSTVFASASVLQKFYGWKLGAPIYALGVFTAMSRWSEGRHWASDTVAGATLGIWMGYAFASAHLGDASRGDAPDSSYVLVPEIDQNQVGLRWTTRL